MKNMMGGGVEKFEVYACYDADNMIRHWWTLGRCLLKSYKVNDEEKHNYIEFYTPQATGFMIGVHEKLFNRSESFLKFTESGSF